MSKTLYIQCCGIRTSVNGRSIVVCHQCGRRFGIDFSDDDTEIEDTLVRNIALLSQFDTTPSDSTPSIDTTFSGDGGSSGGAGASGEW